MSRISIIFLSIAACVILAIYAPKFLDSSHEKVNPVAADEQQSEKLEQNIPKEILDENASESKDNQPEKVADVSDSQSEKTEVFLEDDHTPSSEEDANIPPVTEQIVEGKIESGDSLLVLFEDYSDINTAYALVNMIEKEFSAKSMRVGQPYLIEYDAEKDKIIRFEYEIDAFKKLKVHKKEDNDYFVEIEKIHYDKKLAFVQGTIEDSLFLTVAKLKESPQLAQKVADMFRWDVNFIRDVQKGDSFSILVEKMYREGEFKGYGQTLGASFVNKGKKYESFLFYDSKKKSMYYNASGDNLRKVLLQSPLKFTRVTSGYTHSRKHPVYGTYRPHLGIDYGAPMGTPIMAVGDGTVSYVGWRGGYGKHIVVKHASGLESLYSHLSRYSRGLKKGVRVRQGQTIGYVGSTGVSTGPHLDFRLKQNGKFINPTKAINPRAEAVVKAHKQAFEDRKKMVREYMDGTRALDGYDPASIEI